jgi:hypothetical protein
MEGKWVEVMGNTMGKEEEGGVLLGEELVVEVEWICQIYRH